MINKIIKVVEEFLSHSDIQPENEMKHTSQNWNSTEKYEEGAVVMILI